MGTQTRLAFVRGLFTLRYTGDKVENKCLNCRFVDSLVDGYLNVLYVCRLCETEVSLTDSCSEWEVGK